MNFGPSRTYALFAACMFATTSIDGSPAQAAQKPLVSHALERTSATRFHFTIRSYTIAGKTVNIFIGPPTPYGGSGLTSAYGLLVYTLNGNACCGYNGQVVTMTTSGEAKMYSSSNFSHPNSIVLGPDGHVWFTEEVGTNRIGFITPTGGIGGYPITASPSVGPIVVGSDSRLWFGIDSEPNDQIGAITTAGVLKQYPLPAADARFAGINSITVGPDKNTWFSWGGGVGKITPAGAMTTYNLGFPTNGVATSADGHIWFTLGNAAEIGYVNTSGMGEVDFQPGLTGTPGQIITGPDKNEYFAEYNGTTGAAAIGKVTLNGVLTEYALPYGFVPQSLTVGPDKNIWVDDLYHDQLGQLVL